MKRVPRGLRTTAAVVVVLLCFVYLGRNLWQGMQQVKWSELDFRPLPLVLSALLFALATLIGGLCWSLLLDGLGQRQPWRRNVKVHLQANVAKYLPGYAWQILGKAYLCRQQGLPMGPVGLGIGLEFAAVIVTGVWVALVTVPNRWLEAWGLGGLAALRWPVVLLLALSLAALPQVLRVVINRLTMVRQRAGSITISARPLWWMLLWMILAWVMLGGALYLLIVSLHPLGMIEWPGVTFSWAASAIISLVVVFVPMGIGVKESALAFLLSSSLPGALATVIAILARVLTMLGEAIGFLVGQKL
jgi:hypothetical protein